MSSPLGGSTRYLFDHLLGGNVRHEKPVVPGAYHAMPTRSAGAM